jgi:uncharacterized membrane protein
MEMPWLLTSILGSFLIALVGFLILSVFFRKKIKGPKYYLLSILGIIFLLFGILIRFYLLSGLGFILIILGLIYQKKWKANQAKWEKTKRNQKLSFLVIIISLFLFITGGIIIFYFLDPRTF